MIILKKINSRLVEKPIQPGQTEEFFTLDLNKYESFDWNVKILSGGNRGITKISSLYNDNAMESTSYAFLGKRFKAVTDISGVNGTHCQFKITNNETELINCSVKLKTF
jgi:hypothetical protein